MKLIITHNKIGDIVRIGLYDDDGKWVKWVPKKQLDEYVEKVDSVEGVTK